MRAEPLSSRAIKATALQQETRSILRLWHPGDTAITLRARVLAEGALGKATAARAADVIQNAFVHRLLASGDEPAASVRALLDSRGSGRWLQDLLLLFSARADATVRASIAEFLSGKICRGGLVVDTLQLDGWLEEQVQAGRTAKPWSPIVRKRVAQHVLQQLTDFGVLGRPLRGQRQVLTFRPRLLSVAYLASELHREGLTDVAIVDHDDWTIWQMKRADVLEALHQLAELGLWEVQAAGEVVHVGWRHEQWTDVLVAIGGLPGD